MIAFARVEFPLVTLILPVRNEGVYIQRCLDAILTQDYPADRLQILVVDGLSEDSTREIVGQYAIRSAQHAIFLLDNPQHIVPTALNIGLRHANGQVLMRVDGHCQIPPDYVSRCVTGLATADAACFGGAIETIGETSLAQTIAVAMSSIFGVGGSAFRTAITGLRSVDTLAFGAYSREVIQRCGPFDEELVRNQDEEYNYRLRKMGCVLLMDASLRVRYYSRSSLASLWRQYFQYGYWKVRVLQKHPLQMQWRQFVPPVFVLSLVAGAFLSLLDPRLLWLWLGGVGLYLLTNIAASLYLAARRGWQHLWRLPLVFAILHISYGAGFLVGLVAFARRWGDKGTVPFPVGSHG